MQSPVNESRHGIEQVHPLPYAKWHSWLGIAVSVFMLFFLAWQVYRIDDPSGLIDELAGANYFFLSRRWAVYWVLFPGSVNGGVKVGRVGGERFRWTSTYR